MKKQPKRAKSKQTIETILRTALQLFSGQSYEAVSTNHIAAAAKISIGSMYEYFSDKSDIAAEIIAMHQQDLEQVFVGLRSNMPKDTGELSASLFKGFKHLISGQSFLLSVHHFAAQLTYPAELTSPVINLRNSWLNGFTSAADQAVRVNEATAKLIYAGFVALLGQELEGGADSRLVEESFARFVSALDGLREGMQTAERIDINPV